MVKIDELKKEKLQALKNICYNIYIEKKKTQTNLTYFLLLFQTFNLLKSKRRQKVKMSVMKQCFQY